MSICIHLPTSNPLSLRQLESLIKRAGFVPEQFQITSNHVPNGTKVLIAMGEQSLRLWTGEAGINRYRGHVLGSSPFIVPTFSPDYLLPKRGEESSSKFTGVVIHDIRKAVRIAREGWALQPTHYALDPSPEGAEEWVRAYQQALEEDPETCLAWDIETPYKAKKEDESDVDQLDFDILRISFAFKPRNALTIPWTGPYLNVIKRLLETPYNKCGWNLRQFDIPVVTGNGITVGGENYDLMDAWKVYQSNLPRGLEFVASFYCDWIRPWKHQSKSDFAFYSATDSDATIGIWTGLKKDMEAQEVPSYDLQEVA